MSGSTKMAVAMSVSGPRKATNSGSLADASLLSAMIRSAPDDGAGVDSSWRAVGAPLATATFPARPIRSSSRSTSARDSAMLRSLRSEPK